MGSFGHNRAATFVPVIMALAVISTAFTGQAIAVAFDRRYGALKRLGATPLPVWGINAGKSLSGCRGVLAGHHLGRHRLCARLAAGADGPDIGRRDHRAGYRGLCGARPATRRHLASRDRSRRRQPDVVRIRRFRCADLGVERDPDGVQMGGSGYPVGRAHRGAVAGHDRVGGLVRDRRPSGVGRAGRTGRTALVPVHLNRPPGFATLQPRTRHADASVRGCSFDTGPPVLQRVVFGALRSGGVSQPACPAGHRRNRHPHPGRHRRHRGNRPGYRLRPGVSDLAAVFSG
ncbi:putative unidentified antibiotic-transport integral membrane ABC transporter [Mycobacterium tuberculosis CAS/NITR204]|uniref:Putative unidentified antibiotic-transport integral membrane ABC transporter n=1 Tax=Mycobacterium tuberculosis CAS/NITR204 TaxID=1310114 RepID=R4M818_MYCTX|nr:putative unidentified antibiotic-transport integral membrane ABC transporter [Mycobacterium tuberculosis CAS/NITR204]